MSEQPPEGAKGRLDALVGRDRPATEPGGCECQDCGCIFVGAEWHSVCGVCNAAREQAMRDDQRQAEWREEMRRDAFGDRT